MGEQIYKLTDKGLEEFKIRLSEIGYGNTYQIYKTLLNVIDWDKNNVREIEERNNNATE